MGWSALMRLLVNVSPVFGQPLLRTKKNQFGCLNPTSFGEIQQCIHIFARFYSSHPWQLRHDLPSLKLGVFSIAKWLTQPAS